MEATLHALGAILLKAIPTLLLLIFVHFYLKGMFFTPLRKILQERREATEGARQAAEQAMSNASKRAAEIEAALRKAREDIYQEQEELRKKAVSEQTSRIDQARAQSHALIHQAREQITKDTEAAKRELAGTIEGLADQIARRLLERSAA